MKHFIKIATTLFFVVFLLNSCEKDEIVEDYSSSENKTNNISAYSKSGDPTSTITVENGMMVFSSIGHFIETEHFLNEQLDVWDNSFLDAYGHLDDDSLGSIEEIIGFNDEQPLEDLEVSLGFNSLRKKILLEEDAWLAADGELIADDPDNHYIIDEVIRTLLNEQAEVMIEGSIYVMLESATVQIVDGSMESLDSVRNATNIIEITSSNIKIINYPVTTGSGSSSGGGSTGSGGGSSGGSTSCNAKANKRKTDYKKNSSGKKRIKWVVSVWTHPWDCGAIAKTKHYKKKRGKWKKRRATIYARVYGHMVNDKNNCSQHWVNADESKRRKKVKTQRVGALCKTEKYLIKGNHCGSGITYNSTLSW